MKVSLDDLMKSYPKIFTQDYQRTDECIDSVIEILRDVWKENRDMRLGQLLMNVMRDSGHNQGLNSLWNILDEQWIEILYKKLQNRFDIRNNK